MSWWSCVAPCRWRPARQFRVRSWGSSGGFEHSRDVGCAIGIEHEQDRVGKCEHPVDDVLDDRRHVCGNGFELELAAVFMGCRDDVPDVVDEEADHLATAAD